MSGQLAGVDRGAAEEAEGAAVGAGGRQAVEVADVRVDRLGGRCQARGPWRRPPPGSGTSRAPRPRVRPGRRGGPPRRGRCRAGPGGRWRWRRRAPGRGPIPGGRAGRGRRRPRGRSAPRRGRLLGGQVTLGRRRPESPGRCGDRREVGVGQGAVQGVHADVDRDRLGCRGGSSAVAARAYSLRSGATASSRSTMTTSAPAARALATTYGRSPGDVEPGQRGVLSQGALLAQGRSISAFGQAEFGQDLRPCPRRAGGPPSGSRRGWRRGGRGRSACAAGRAPGRRRW